jgi:Family of unknown function (DUF6521)
MLKTWTERPQDVSNLLNPAFLGLLIHRAVGGFKREQNNGMPFELAFLVLPLVLHGATRARLPRAVSTSLPTWLQENRDALVGFGQRTGALVPYTREAIEFLLQRAVIVVDDEGRLDIGLGPIRGVTKYQQTTEEIEDCYKRAEFVGRWLALAGNSATIYVLFEIRP